MNLFVAINNFISGAWFWFTKQINVIIPALNTRDTVSRRKLTATQNRTVAK